MKSESSRKVRDAKFCRSTIAKFTKKAKLGQQYDLVAIRRKSGNFAWTSSLPILEPSDSRQQLAILHKTGGNWIKAEAAAGIQEREGDRMIIIESTFKAQSPRFCAPKPIASSHAYARPQIEFQSSSTPTSCFVTTTTTVRHPTSPHLHIRHVLPHRSHPHRRRQHLGPCCPSRPCRPCCRRSAG